MIGENSMVRYSYRESDSVSRTVEFFRFILLSIYILPTKLFEIQSKSATLPAKINIWKSLCPISNVRNVTKKL